MSNGKATRKGVPDLENKRELEWPGEGVEQESQDRHCGVWLAELGSAVLKEELPMSSAALNLCNKVCLLAAFWDGDTQWRDPTQRHSLGLLQKIVNLACVFKIGKMVQGKLLGAGRKRCFYSETVKPRIAHPHSDTDSFHIYI